MVVLGVGEDEGRRRVERRDPHCSLVLFQGGLVFKAHRLVYHSTLCSRRRDPPRLVPILQREHFIAT